LKDRAITTGEKVVKKVLFFLHGFLGDVRRMVEQRIGRPSLDVRDRTGNYSSVWLPLAASELI
jgi:hypothetical protein